MTAFTRFSAAPPYSSGARDTVLVSRVRGGQTSRFRKLRNRNPKQVAMHSRLYISINRRVRARGEFGVFHAEVR